MNEMIIYDELINPAYLALSLLEYSYTQFIQTQARRLSEQATGPSGT